jgi:signal transduction histidine kinase
MEELATGHFKVTSQNAKTVEIKAIIDAFNAMAMALALKAEERRAVEKQRKKLENELRQKYKMEAVGLMAGGIAHNFNNNLAIILGNLELIQLKTVDNDSIADHLRDANIAVQRARELTKQILTYSRRDAHPAEQIKIVKVVAETVQLLRSTIPTTVNLICRIPEELSETVVEGDSTRIQEALINLCNNAVQAMDEKGDLTIDLSKKEVRPAEVPAGSPCRAGAYVRLSVADTGCGMPPAVMEKIFDPFFTTKDVDQGTGMGLSTVHGIVEQHKGFVSVSSTPGRGSVFDLFLPESDATGLFPARRESNDLPRGFERILFVDDDALLADLGVMLLSNQGYHVEASTSSLAALERFAEDPNRFDLLITDQTMPQMTGLDLARQVRRIRPAMPVILSTGYSSKTSPEELARHGINAFCLKPLKLADLAQTVRFVLDNIKH